MATKNKKSTPVKKAAKPKQNKSYKQTKSVEKQKKAVYIAPYIIFIAALFITLTFFFDTKAVGSWVNSALDWLVGKGKYFLPIYMFALSFMWKSDREKNALPLKSILYSVNLLTLLMVIRLAKYESGVIFNWFTDLLTEKAIGTVATWVLAVIFFAVSLILLCGSTPDAVVRNIIKFFKEADYSAVQREHKEKAPKVKEVKEVKAKPVKAPAPIVEDDGQRKFDLPVMDDMESKAAPEEKHEINREDPWDEKVKEQDVPVSEPEASAEEVIETVAEEVPVPEAAPEAEGEDEPLAEDIESLEDEEPILETEDVEVPEAPYVFPPLSLLIEGNETDGGFTQADIRATGQKLIETLESFGARAKIVNTSCGPTVTRFELQPEIGVKVKQIINLSEDIALHLSASSVRVEPIPGKGAVGVEVPNRRSSIVRLHDLIATPTFRDSTDKLLTCLGKDIAGNPVFLDIKKMPHLLIAGATGQGKSVCLNSLIISLLYKARPEEVKLILIDPKKLELSDYNGLPHLLVPVVTEPKKAAGTLNWAVMEMERRFERIQDVSARDSREYNEAIAGDPEKEYMPDVVIVIDELADLMMTAPDDVETSICRLAQKARAAGMHLVIGTQRPSTDVITGLIKANIPSRIAFTVVSRVDSDIILGQSGAERLLGKGDMLYAPVSAIKPLRVQGAFVDGKKEVTAVTQFIKSAANVAYDESVMEKIEQEAKMCGVKKKKVAVEEDGGAEDDDKDDPIKIKAIEVALEYGTISTSLLQRRLSLGYAKAARIVDKLERSGVIGEFDPTTKKRAILITPEEFAEMKLNLKSGEEE
ncbi:MAG: DNA translocase FtsK [Clostridia bacterium]|nr:DNA translocase FtsK [Clostridia bacterium]